MMQAAIGRHRGQSLVAYYLSRLQCSTNVRICSPIRQIPVNRSFSSCAISRNSASPTNKPPIVPQSTNIKPDKTTYTDAELDTIRLNTNLHFADKCSPGSPFFLPGGARIFAKLVAFLRAQYTLYGYDEVITPTIYKKSLWKQSGHWDNYQDAMFSVTGRGASGAQDATFEIGQEEEYGLKPMNCPGHCILFKKWNWSYRDLPVRFAEFAPLHRNEIASALTGLKRVRRFHQDDAHIFCRPSQVEAEISSTLKFIDAIYKVFKLPSYKLVLSTRPTMSYIGELEIWDKAEAALKASLDASGREWSLNEGDGAFYGPKIDVILKDSAGREQQTATIQLDFQLPIRFDLRYTKEEGAVDTILQNTENTVDNASLLMKTTGTQPTEVQNVDTISEKLVTNVIPIKPKVARDSGSTGGPSFGVPVMIHRAILGSVERFMAMLIEHYNGYWPFWLNPNQAIVIPTKNEGPVFEYAQQVAKQISGVVESHGTIQPLSTRTFQVDFEKRDLKMSKKLKMAYLDRYQYMIVVGTREMQSGKYELVDLRNKNATTKDLTSNEIYQHFLSKEDAYE